MKKEDISLGEFKWLTVVSPDELDGVQLLLEPNNNPAAKTFQAAIFEQDIAATSFAVADIQREYERLQSLGVRFTMPPTDTRTQRLDCDAARSSLSAQERRQRRVVCLR